MSRILRSIADHAFATLSNVIVSLAVVRSAGAEGLGQFQVVFTGYLIMLGFARALVAEPLLVSSVSNRSSQASATTIALLHGSMWSILGLIAAVALDNSLLVFPSLAAPLLLVQDTARYIHFKAGSPQRALHLDVGWTVVSLLGTPWVLSAGAEAAVAVWTLGGALGGAFAVISLRMACRTEALLWWRSHARGLGQHFLTSSLAFTLGSQGLLLYIAVVAGESALGVVRAGMIYFGPVQLGLTAVGMVILPQLSDRWSQPIAFRPVTWAATATAAVMALVALRGTLIPILFGATWTAEDQVLNLLALNAVLLAVGWVWTIRLRSQQMGREFSMLYVAAYLGGLGPAALLANTGRLVSSAWAVVIQSAIFSAYGAYLSFRSRAND